MINIDGILSSSDPETLAQRFLKLYFASKQTVYPINPFQVLTDLGIPFVFRPFEKYEGVYISAIDQDDIPVVGINLNRPVTRQRFTAAHELCHHLKDRNIGVTCPISGKKNSVEKYAEKFAAAILMPIEEISIQANKYLDENGYISFDNVLHIADYFGVSFQACIFRLAYKLHMIDGDTDSESLRRRIKQFCPAKKRQQLDLTDSGLFSDIIDASEPWIKILPSPSIKYKFQNDYIFNDSRLEGVDIPLDKASEIVADIRINKKGSIYCCSEYKEEIEVAGHAVMYNSIFDSDPSKPISIYNILELNRLLFSCSPCPEYGGTLRTTNTLVIGAKFDTYDFGDIPNAIINLNPIITNLISREQSIKLSDYIKETIVLHHKLTQIHPFADGNGRTTRAFLNLIFLHKHIPPVYFKIENKQEYIEALSAADRIGNYDPLYEVFFKAILRSHSELTSFPKI